MDKTEIRMTCFYPALNSKASDWSCPVQAVLKVWHSLFQTAAPVRCCSGCTSCTKGKAMFSQKHGNCGALTRCTCNNCIYPHETQTETGIKYPLGSQNPNKGLRSHTTVKYKSAIYPFPGKHNVMWLRLFLRLLMMTEKKKKKKKHENLNLTGDDDNPRGEVGRVAGMLRHVLCL